MLSPEVIRHRENGRLRRIMMQTSGKKEIPRFYFPTGPPLSPTARMLMESKIDSLMKRHSQGIAVPAIKELFTEVRRPDHWLPLFQPYLPVFTSIAVFRSLSYKKHVMYIQSIQR